MDTCAPSPARARATARPRPLLAPPTIATFPCNPKFIREPRKKSLNKWSAESEALIVIRSQGGTNFEPRRRRSPRLDACGIEVGARKNAGLASDNESLRRWSYGHEYVPAVSGNQHQDRLVGAPNSGSQ